MTGAELPGVFGTLAPYLHDYGYAAVAVVVALENLGLLVPGEAIVITAALFARTGQLDVWVVGLIAFAAAFLADNVSYAIGRFGGRPLVLRVGRLVRITAEHLDRVEGFFAAYGSRVVIVARFLPVLRHLNGIAAGVSRMPLRAWLLTNAAGAALWSTIWTTVGYQAGGHLEGVELFLTRWLPAIGVVVVVGVVIYAVRRRRRARTAARDALPAPATAVLTPTAEG